MQPVTRFQLFGIRLGVAALALYWVAIFVGTHLPKLPAAARGVNDKVAHFSAFFGLAWLLCYCTNGGNAWRRFGMVIALCLAYAGIDELSQTLVRGRTADPLDFLADAAGTFAAVAIYLFLRAMFYRRDQAKTSARNALSSSTAD